MTEIIFKFVLGLIILLFSTNRLVGLAEKVSRILRLSPLIIGITVVAIGTSLPELTVSLISILRGDAGLAMGNIIGSNIVNVLLVFPVGLFIGKLRIGTTKTQRNALILLGVTVIFCLTQLGGPVKAISGVFLIGLAILVSIVEYKLAVFGRKHEDSRRFKATKTGKFSLNLVFSAGLMVLGIILGGILVVNTVESISLLTGISTTILGLTLTAIATSLPELMTTIFSQEDHQEKITIGNILGSNIYNLLLVGGIVTLFTVSATIQMKEWVWLMATTIIFVLILRYFKGQKPPRFIGGILFILLFAYLLSQ